MACSEFCLWETVRSHQCRLQCVGSLGTHGVCQSSQTCPKKCGLWSLVRTSAPHHTEAVTTCFFWAFFTRDLGFSPSSQGRRPHSGTHALRRSSQPVAQKNALRMPSFLPFEKHAKVREALCFKSSLARVVCQGPVCSWAAKRAVRMPRFTRPPSLFCTF